MWPDRVSNPGPLTNESGALPTALCGSAIGLADGMFMLQTICNEMYASMKKTPFICLIYSLHLALRQINQL